MRDPDSCVPAIETPGPYRLQRDFAIQLCILGQVNFAHSTFPDLGDDAVMRQRCIGQQWFLLLHCNIEAD